MLVLSGCMNISKNIDINCDLGESMNTDELIMPYISSANIACGYHAGNIDTMQQTIALCIQHNVAIGAHPSFYDKENFGRVLHHLSWNELYEIIFQQLFIFNEVAASFDKKMTHVKPHGALYNLSAKDSQTANCIAMAVKNYDKEIKLVGLSGSHSITEAQAAGLQTISEVFADRTYQDDGSLTPRSEQHAVIDDVEKAVQQAVQFCEMGSVLSIANTIIPIKADTICIHGDTKNAVEFAKQIHQALQKNNITIHAIN